LLWGIVLIVVGLLVGPGGGEHLQQVTDRPGEPCAAPRGGLSDRVPSAVRSARRSAR
jgi:hypothetical protein